MLPSKRLFAHMQGMMAGRQLATALFLSMCFVTASSRVDDSSEFSGKETILTPQFVEKMVKRSSLEVIATLKKAMRKGFQGLKRDLKIERTRRKGLEEKIEKCMCGSQTASSTTTMATIARSPSITTMATTTRRPSTTTMATTTRNPIACPDGYTEVRNRCYRFDMESLTLGDAKWACKNRGGYLVSINTKAEQDYLTAYIMENIPDLERMFWIGMTLVGGRKMWMDGTKVTFTNWDCASQDCMEDLGCGVALNIVECGFKWQYNRPEFMPHYICERSKPQPEGATTQTIVPDIERSTVSTCSRGFIGFEGHCYRFEMKKKTWRKARRACVRKGAYLASVNSQSEQDFLVTQIRNNQEYSTSDNADSYWLGMEYLNGKFRWSDGTDVNYTSWGDREPDCVTRGCAVFISEFLDYDWEDATSRYHCFSICEMEI